MPVDCALLFQKSISESSEINFQTETIAYNSSDLSSFKLYSSMRSNESR